MVKRTGKKLLVTNVISVKWDQIHISSLPAIRITQTRKGLFWYWAIANHLYSFIVLKKWSSDITITENETEWKKNTSLLWNPPKWFLTKVQLKPVVKAAHGSHYTSTFVAHQNNSLNLGALAQLQTWKISSLLWLPLFLQWSDRHMSPLCKISWSAK